MVIVVMGVSGVGKTTIGQQLAAAQAWHFIDADDLHPEANRQKMASGQPLTDADRWPWLALVRQQIEAACSQNQSLVLACSALRADYRAYLQINQQVHFVHLVGDPGLIQARLQQRSNHFMPSSLLTSQLATLEIPSNALTLNVDAEPSTLVERIQQWILGLE
ncbi:gluconokinase [Herpetosiphon geysericola]|uniref:Gluconokinase n=1 Tax=Herpetosiphon geysericola TaxID=70996 RepID=A0A0N8GRA1_9CHLR|nr:gluconokinase [Herpetosiphon geysericola]KPL85922.1 gluconate kinase [Herpetosiphon geysericola]